MDYRPALSSSLRLVAVVLWCLFVVAGCASAEPTADDTPTGEPAPTHGVDADELADNPCGTSRWDEPPPEVDSLDDD